MKIHCKVVFCRVLTNRTRGIYPGYYYPIKNFFKFGTTFIPVPETSVSSARHAYPYPELLEFLYARGHNTRGTGTACFCTRAELLTYVRLCHNARNFRKFCKTSVPVPRTSGSSVRLSYPYPEFLEVLKDPHTLTRNSCDSCKTVAQ